MIRTSRGLLCAFLLTTLLACKVIDKLREKGDTAQSDQGVASGSAAPAADNAPGQAKSAKNDVVAVTGKFAALPLRVGQMVSYRRKGESALMSYAVVGKERGAWKLQVVSPTPAGKTVTDILLQIDDNRDPDSLKLLSATVKAPGMPTLSFDDKQAQMLGKISQGIVQSVKMPDFDGAPREDVVVPGGRFQGAVKIHQKQKVLGFESDTTSWHHPSIPITTMVKVEGSFQGKPTTLELVDYSLVGAMKAP